MKRARCFSGSHSSTEGGNKNPVCRSIGRKLLVTRRPRHAENQFGDSNASRAAEPVKSDRLLEESLRGVKSDIGEIKNHRHSDFVHMIEMFAAGFVLLAGMLIAAYFIIDGKFDKLGDRVDRLSTTSTRVDAKLEDLLARI